MDTSSIAALASNMSQANVKMQTNFSVARKVMDVAEQQGQNLVKMIEESPTAAQGSATPHLGTKVDIRV